MKNTNLERERRSNSSDASTSELQFRYDIGILKVITQ